MRWTLQSCCMTYMTSLPLLFLRKWFSYLYGFQMFFVYVNAVILSWRSHDITWPHLEITTSHDLALQSHDLTYGDHMTSHDLALQSHMEITWHHMTLHCNHMTSHDITWPHLEITWLCIHAGGWWRWLADPKTRDICDNNGFLLQRTASGDGRTTLWGYRSDQLQYLHIRFSLSYCLLYKVTSLHTTNVVETKFPLPLSLSLSLSLPLPPLSPLSLTQKFKKMTMKQWQWSKNS